MHRSICSSDRFFIMVGWFEAHRYGTGRLAGFFVSALCAFPGWTFLVYCDTRNGHMKIPDNLKFDEKGLIPAVIQDCITGEVLMVAYMNAESVRKTIETGLTWFWSRSRKKFWQKGETSGHIQRVKDILYDCDQDTLLVKVEQSGPACHTGERSCFFRRFEE
jgi:phosphoribosyl-AMP cyclohydrolase